MILRQYLLVLLSILFMGSHVIAQSNSDLHLIQAGKTYSDSLQLKTPHVYNIELDSGQFIFGYVMQQTVDVKIKVTNPQNEIVGTFDSPARGRESFQFDTDTKGRFQIEVAPFKEETGNYALTVSKVEEIASDPEQRIDQLMTAYSENVPGAEALVMKDGEILFSKAYGMANLSYDILFKVSTRTNIGSTSKQFTAFAIALLAEKGKLSFDDDIRKHIPELPEFDHKITLRNLVSHTSGLREYLNLLSMTGRNMSSSLEREKIIEIVQRQDELQNVPGAEWNYNNTGYVLLAEVVHRVTDTPFDQWMTDNVFQPLGMDSTMIRMDPSQIVPNRAQGYSRGEDGAYIEAKDLGGAAGAGGIYTTLQDLSNWIRNYDEPKLGNENLIQEMMTAVLLNDSSSTNYGLGLFVQEYKGLKYVHHGGADVAHRSMMMYFPEINAAVITQSNNAGFDGSIAPKIANLFFEQYFEEKKKPDQETIEDKTETTFDYDKEKFEALAGKYELKIMPGFVMSFHKDGDRIYAQATGQPEVDLRATSDSTFTLIGVPATLTFHLKQDGSADSLTLHQNGHHIAKKIQWSPNIGDLKEYTGVYFSEEIEAHYSIVIEDSSLVLQHYQMEDKKLTPTDNDHFNAGFPISNIEFIRDENGVVLGFKGSNGRTKGVFFEKWD